jgi:hypothetical protein
LEGAEASAGGGTNRRLAVELAATQRGVQLVAVGLRPAGSGTQASNKGYEGDVMPPRGVREGSKRDRQYEHIKDSLREQGESEDKAEEIAARTVNKERARHGESATASRTSTDDISSGRRGGQRAHRKGPRGRTKAQLYNEARQLGIEGRSKMRKAELQRAVEAKKAKRS